MIHWVTLKKKWINPDSGKEFKKGDRIALHPSKAQELVSEGIGECESVNGNDLSEYKIDEEDA